MSQRFFNINEIRNKKYLIFSLFIMVFLVSHSIIISINFHSDLDLTVKFVPRLKSKDLIFNKSIISYFYTDDFEMKYSKEDSGTLLQSQFVRYSTGPYSGLGNNNFTGYDFLNISNVEFLSLTDTTTQPSVHTDSFNINIPSNYINTTGWFNISNITPLYDWRHIENDRNGSYVVPSINQGIGPDFIEAAMQFNFTEEYMNLSTVRVVTYPYQSTSEQDPTGEIVILNSTWNSGNSRWEPDESAPLVSVSLLPLTGWREYIFPADLTLRGDRSYFLVLNDTSTTDAYWEWGAQKDPDSGDPNDDDLDEGWMFFKTAHGSSIWEDDVFGEYYDLNLRIYGKPVQKSGSSFIDKKYKSPQELNFIYSSPTDSTALSRFTWFDWNASSSNNHQFNTNTSMSFDVTWIVNLTYQGNPISIFSQFLVNNNTLTEWNLTFLTPSIISSYNIKNRTFIVTSLPSDWNGSAIYRNGILEYNTSLSGGLNSSVFYANQSSTMIINASDLSSSSNWEISFDAPNYIEEFKILEDGTSLEFPQKANVTDLLELEFKTTFNGNLTYWIDSPDNSELYKAIDINSTHTVFSELWDINSAVSQTTNVNGTYKLQSVWINSDKTRVGIYTRRIDIIISTSFSVQAETEVIIGDLFNVTATYKSIHNDSNILDAPIYCEANWTSNVFMNQLADKTYNASFDTSLQNAGETGHINITTQLGWFVNWTIQISVFFVQNSILQTNITNLILEWQENTTIKINYNYSDSDAISGASISVNGDSFNTIEISGIYYYKFNSSLLGGTGTYLNLEIIANHPKYMSKNWEFNVTITPGRTGIDAGVGGIPIINDTTIITKSYSDSSQDNIKLNLEYYSVLLGTFLDPLVPSISSPVPIDSYIQELNNSWTITINPNQTGSMVLEFTFSLLNYQSALFILHINIIPANTNIFTNLISPTTVYYNDTLEFFLFFENTDYSENISGVTPVPLDTKVRFINQTGNFYWFNFSSEMLLTGIHAIDISFSDPYFEDNSIVVQFDVSKVPNHITDLIPSNMTTIGEMSLFNYTNSQTISITWIDDFSGLGIIDYDIIFSGNGSSFISIDSKHDNGTHFFIFLGSAVGKYQVIITFETAYYSSTNYVIYFIISEMETRMIDVANLDYNETLMAEEIFTLVIPSYQTYGGINILQIDNLIFWINGTEVFGAELELNLISMPFSINLSTSGYHYGFYNFTIEISTLGYQFQRFSLNVTINGWETTIDVNVEPGNIIERGQEISFFITLSYKNPLLAGFGSTINLINLEGVEITFSIELKYINGSTQLFQEVKMTDSLGKTSYTIPGAFTKSATGFTQIRISAGSSMSGLPYIYSLTAEELAEYKITEIINPLEVLLQGALFLSILAVIFLSVYSINKRRVRKKSIKRLAELNIEQSFEDIKSIRLIIARHESGLQFYSEKTITDMATDTDALSGMSAAISTFMEELSDTMTHATEEREKDKIEVMSREGLHLLVWHGNQSSLIIISEIRLPDYFQGRLKTLGRELENRFSEDLKDFYATDQIPSHIVKKMVRKHIPLHYFCAFVLNEGVLTLDSIKLPKKYKSMFEQIKEIRFEKQGVQYLFSEQIISHLSKRYKRSEAIKFLDYAIDINLLIETSQEDIANLGKN